MITSSSQILCHAFYFGHLQNVFIIKGQDNFGSFFHVFSSIFLISGTV